MNQIPSTTAELTPILNWMTRKEPEQPVVKPEVNKRDVLRELIKELPVEFSTKQLPREIHGLVTRKILNDLKRKGEVEMIERGFYRRLNDVR